MNLVEDLGKRSKSSDQLLRGQQGRIKCSTCGKLHDGVFIPRVWLSVPLGLFPCSCLGYTFKHFHMSLACRELRGG